MRWNRLAALILLSAGCLVSCGDDGGDKSIPSPGTTDAADTGAVQDTPPPPEDAPPRGEPDETPEPHDPGPPPGPSKLRFEAKEDVRGPCASSCLFVLVPGQSMELAVLYEEEDGSPIPDAEVDYESTASEGQAKLQAKMAFTDEKGRASVGLDTFAESTGQFEVTAEVPGDPGAGRLTFKILMAVDAKPPLMVDVNYAGKQAVTTFDVRVFLVEGGKPTCAEVHPNASGPALPAVKTLTAGLGSTAVFDTLPGLDEQGKQSWTVQVRGPAGGVPKVVGCEQAVAVEAGKTTKIEVKVDDLPLAFQGAYDVKTWMDLYTGLSGTAGQVVQILIGLFTEPGKTAVVAACKNPSGMLDTICDFLVDGSGNLGAVGQVVAEAADEIFFELMADHMPSGVFFTGQSLAQTLKQIRFGSRLDLYEEPSIPATSGGGAKFAAGSVYELWEIVSFYWKWGTSCDPADTECGLIHVKLNDIYTAGKLEAYPEAGVTDVPELWIAAHEIPGFSYGTLVNFLVEKKFLPMLFGDGTEPDAEYGGFLPEIDSYEKLVATIFGDKYCLKFEHPDDPYSEYGDCCWWFEQKIADDVYPWLLPFADPACTAAIPAAGGWIRSQVAGLSGNLTIGTPEGSPAPALDQNGDLTVDNLASKSAPALWDALWEIAGQTFAPDATWFAKHE